MKVLDAFSDDHRTRFAAYAPHRRHDLPDGRTRPDAHRRRDRRALHLDRLPTGRTRPGLPVGRAPACRRGAEAVALRDHAIRLLTGLPTTGHPVRLRVRTPRFTCNSDECAATTYRQSPPGAAEDGTSTTRRVTRWILQ